MPADAPASPASLLLSDPTPFGRQLGLQAGDRLVAINGGPVDPRPELLKTRFAKGLPAALQIERRGQRWLILSDSAALGRWRRDTAPVMPDDTGPIDPAGLRNWEILRAPDGRYDLHPVAQPGLALVAPPLWLLQTRLWGPLALWAALVLVGLPAGWPAMAGLHAITSVYFWKTGPALWRSDRAALGLHPDGVVAAATERAVHAHVRALHPGARYLHLPARAMAPAPQTGL